MQFGRCVLLLPCNVMWTGLGESMVGGAVHVVWGEHGRSSCSLVAVFCCFHVIPMFSSPPG